MIIKTDLGTIGISNQALAAVAMGAAQSCFGVRAVGRGGVMAQLLGREPQGPVAVHPAADGAVRLELHIAMGYGVNIPAICRSIIAEIRYTVEKQTGVAVSGVDIFVDALRP